MAAAGVPVPEQGQLVKVRHRHYIVQDVWGGSVDPSRPEQHRVRLEALDDDQVGEELAVIWEHEINTQVMDALGLPRPDSWDPMDRFDAFLLASRWSLSSVLEGLPLQAPFRGAIQIEEYQLEPVVRALRMPRVNLLVADDVGLGKTIEAGMVVQELLARQRARRMLVICPASLQRQWADEMLYKFALRFEVVDRAYVQRLRKEYGVHVNPWASYPRLITSMDFIKREAPLNTFMQALRKDRKGGLPDWDLLIVDEAHNVAPSGRKSYVRDSDRTEMMRQVLPYFEHRLFLTATPHNGFTESFTAMLEMLDPLRFARGPEVDKDQLAAVMIRRLKDDMVDQLGRRRFPKRRVDAIEPAIDLSKAKAEREMFETLDSYITSRLGRSGSADRLPVQFALTMLKKRLLSSPLAFHNSMMVHQSHLVPEEGPESTDVVEHLQKRMSEDFSDDDEKDRTEETAQAESAAFFDVTGPERQLVDELVKISYAAQEKPDAKTKTLLSWIESHLFTKGKWNDERLIIFTEYKDTLSYLERELRRKGWKERVMTLYGGMPDKDGKEGRRGRESIKAAFRAPPDEEPVRILVATDTASEGLNLQDHCRYLLHWEIPWNPNRMEQRNGRIDRHGQNAEEVFCHHFTYKGWEDQRFLDVVVDKVRTQREDLGSVGDVIAAQVERALRGETRTITTPEDRRKIVSAEVKAEVVTKEQIRQLQRQLTDARRAWHIHPETLRMVLHEGLILVGHKGLTPKDAGDLAGKAWTLPSLPPMWADCRPFIQDSKGRLLKLVFDDALAKDRKDVALIHLDHPLLKRALAVFRANLWSVGLHESHQLSRASYRVLPRSELPSPVVVLVSRLICISQLGHKLHEDLLLTGGDLDQREIVLDEQARLEKLLDIGGSHPPLPKTIAASLRSFFPAHEKILREALEKQAKSVDAEIKERLKARGEAESKDVRALINERLREIRTRVNRMEKFLGSDQLLLFDDGEKDQYRRDVSWLKGRMDSLVAEREVKPDAVKSRYEMRDEARTFPLALIYLLPDSLVQGGK